MSVTRQNAAADEAPQNGAFRNLVRNNWPLKLAVAVSIILAGFMADRLINVVSMLEEWPPIKAAVDFITEVTLVSTAALLSTLGFDVYTIPEVRELGMEDFYVYVWGPCSGIEGFALISIFLSIYLWMFRKDMHFPRAFLLFPSGVALSWC